MTGASQFLAMLEYSGTGVPPVLMLVILNVSTGAQEKGITAGMAAGGVIGAGGVVRGTHQRRVHELGPFARPLLGVRPLGAVVDLYRGAPAGRGARGFRLPLCSRERLLSDHDKLRCVNRDLRAFQEVAVRP